MRLIPLVVALAAVAQAVKPESKQVLITYPNDTPPHVLEQAKDALRSAGGVITHEFSLIRGFSATVAQAALEKISAMSSDFPPSIEEDQKVSVQ